MKPDEPTGAAKDADLAVCRPPRPCSCAFCLQHHSFPICPSESLHPTSGDTSSRQPSRTLRITAPRVSLRGALPLCYSPEGHLSANRELLEAGAISSIHPCPEPSPHGL